MNQPNNHAQKGRAHAGAKVALLLLLLGLLLSMTPFTQAKEAETTTLSGANAPQADDVLIVVNPATRSLIRGQTFIMSIQVQAGAQQVEGVSARLDFDPTVLQVESITSVALPTWEIVSENMFDNNSGQINYAVGISRPQFWPYPTGTFDLLQVQFLAMANAPSTTIGFHTGAPRNTDVTAPGGASVLTGRTDGTVVVSPLKLKALAGLDSIQANWNLEAPLPGRLERYELYRNADGGSYTFLTSTTGSQYTDDDPTLTTGVEYCYQVRAIDSANNVIVESNFDCAEFGTLALWVPDEVAPPGAIDVDVPINIGNASGLCIGAMSVTISYDSAIAVATGRVQPTIYTQGYLFSVNTTVPGQIKISSLTLSCNPLHGGGSLFVVGFDIVGQEGQVSPLDFITGLTETVIYDENDFFTPIDLGLQNGSLNVGLSFIRGDLNGDGVVNIADARLALYFANGERSPTPEQERACDVNGDGVCNPGDANLILCYANFQDWNACTSGSSRLLDVAQLLDGPVELAFGSIQTLPEDKIRVPIMLGNAPDFTGASFSFLYDDTQMMATGAFTTSLTSDFLLEANTEQPGLLRVALASDQPIGADGAIIELEFSVSNEFELIDFGSVRLYDNMGRDFVTSSLQREIELTPQSPPSDIDGSVTLEGRPAAPDPSWSVELTVSLTKEGATSEFTPTTDENGHFTITDVEQGTYDIRVKKSTTLQNQQTITLVDGTNSIDLGTLREGDADNNNVVNILDFSLLAGAFGKCEGTTGYDEGADFNGDGCVTILDFSLLAGNFGQAGASPWPSLRLPDAPSRATGEVTIVVEPVSEVKAGELFNVAVELEAGSQLVDGAQVALTFDPAVLEVVDVTAGADLPDKRKSFPLELQKQFDNASGTIQFAAGTLEEFPSGTIDLLQIEFRALAETTGTKLRLQDDSNVTFAGTSLLDAESAGVSMRYQLHMPLIIRSR